MWKEANTNFPNKFTNFYTNSSMRTIRRTRPSRWHYHLEVLEHEHEDDMVCEKTKITKSEMTVTDEDHLSRM